MTTSGRWASVRFPDGRVRFDWVPAAQPPAPRGERGSWHVVTGDSRRPNRWEWHREERPPEMPPAPPESLPPVRPERPAEVLSEQVYRTKRTMGVWFWLGALILSAIGGAGAVAMTHENRTQASFAVDSRPDNDVPHDDDAKPTRAGLIAVAEGYLNALLGGDLDDLVSYLDPSCDGADPGYAVATRWAEEVADGAEVTVEEVEVRGRRGSVTEFDLSSSDDDVRDLITDETADGEQAFPWRFTDGEWYFKGECGSPTITTDRDDRTSTVPDGGDDDAEN